MVKVKIGVYGSLRKGEYNYEFHLNKYEPIETIKLRKHKMYSVGAYPAIQASKDINDKVILELYEVEAEDFVPIHKMELGAGYDFDTVEVSGKKYFFYYYPSCWDMTGYKIIPNGDWVGYRKGLREEATK